MKRSFAAVIAAIFAIAASACSLFGERETTQINNLIGALKQAGFTIDHVQTANGTEPNAYWETEIKEKKRVVKGKSTTITKNSRIAEVVVVIAGNCKVEFEMAKDTGANQRYLDEIRGQNGEEVSIDPNFQANNPPNLQDIEKYFSQRKSQFGYCYQQPYQVSQTP